MKTIYFSKNKHSFKFKIIDGSGEFQINLNDSSIAEKQVVGREITILPKKEGSLLITVQDIDIPQSEPTSAVLHISDITSLMLNTKVHLIE